MKSIFSPIYSYVSILFLLLSPLVIKAQPTNTIVGDVVMPAPNAGALGKYGDIPVSLFTGTPNISVPIHTLKEGTLSLPISLNYHASGIRVAETASWVGIGWSLQAGGIITRTTQGLDDDLSPNGFYHHAASDLDLYDLLSIQSYNNGTKDAEPDIYSFNVAGHSGKFFFDANQNIHLVPKQDLKLEVGQDGGTSGTFDQFTLIAPDGTKYYFGKDPLEPSRKAMEYTSSTGESGNKPTASSWYLVRIESHDAKHTIKLLYENEKYSYINLSGRRYIDATYSGGDCGSGYKTGVEPSSMPNFDMYHHYLRANVDGMRLSQITTNTTTVDFVVDTGNSREDLGLYENSINSSKKLDAIEISSGSYCTKFALSHSYFHDKVTNSFENEPFAKRLKLLSVQQKDCNETLTDTIPPYIFEYEEVIEEGVSFLPHRLNKAVDHWGFYNGADGSETGRNNNEIEEVNTPLTVQESNGTNYQYGDAYREADFDYAKIGVLKKITYPTGGHTEFTYESNKFLGEVPSGNPFNQLEFNNNSCVNANGTYDIINCCGNYSYVDTFTITSLDQIDDLHFRLYFGTGCASSPHIAEIDVYRDSDNAHIGHMSTGDNEGNASAQWHQLSALETIGNFGIGTYRFEFEVYNGVGIFTLEERPTTLGSKDVGGLRIQAIRTHDGEDVNKDMVKTYSYIDENDQESGRLTAQPKYAVSVSHSLPCTYDEGAAQSVSYSQVNGVIFFDQSYVPLSSFDGRHVVYGQVKESLNGNGYKTYKFNHTIDNQNYYAPSYPTTPAKLDPYEGTPEIVKQYDQNDAIVAQTNTYPHGNPLITSIPKTYYKFTSGVTFNATLGPGETLRQMYLNTPYLMETSIYRVYQVEEILDGVSILTTYDYDYDYNDGDPDNDHYFPTSISMTNSDGKVYTTLSEYPFNFSGAVYDAMVSRNMIATPVRVTKDVDGTVIDGTETIYDFFDSSGNPGGSGNDPIYPKLYNRLEKTWDSGGNLIGDNNWQLLGGILTYDPVTGKPKSFQQAGWEVETYTWDPVNKQIKTRTFKDFTWTYNYETGTSLLSEIIDIDGQDTDFTYDALMRLATATARDGNVTTTYNYHYGNGSTDKGYVKSRTDFTPVGESQFHWQESRQYFDGLGRPLQTVQLQHTPGESDLVTNAVEYDNQGRVIKQYESFAGGSSGSYVAPTGAHTLTEYYDNPLNRIHKVTPPSWFATTYAYGSNAGSVSSGGVSYGTDALMTTSATDPEGITSIGYKDKRGRSILSEIKKGSDLSQTSTLYDDKDRVKTVLPPGVSSVTSPLAFQYEYDGADNVVRKYIPDMGWSDFLYDERNLLTGSQDPKLLTENKWLVSLYDDYGRVVNTGFYNENSSNLLDGNAPEVHQLLSSTVYDGACGQSEAIYLGKICQSRTRMLNTNNWLESNMEYDDFGRVIKTSGNNHIELAVGSETITSNYDWADNLMSVNRIHEAFGQQVVINERMTYDHAGRLIDTYHRVGTGAEQLISRQDYTNKDELGIKHLGGYGTNSFLQKIDYSYLPNGFLTDINSTMEANDLFQLNIKYDQVVSGVSAQAQKNGNISQLIWQIKGDEQQSYGFQYDFLHRLQSATYGDYSTGSLVTNNHYNTAYTYDERGNLGSLVRNGAVEGQGFPQIDNLSYGYNTGTSNRLENISDNAPSGSKASGFSPGTGGNYGYDENGNMNYDPHKEINITYNFLNLPEFIEFPDCETLGFTYDAGGVKLRKTLKSSTAVIYTQDYVGGIEYRNGVLEAIYHREGRVYYDNDQTRYEYTLSDHLGNNRLTFTDRNDDGAIDLETEVLEKTHYYPFGMRMEGNGRVDIGRENQYLFNGIERNEDLGLNWDLAFYRSYDPTIGRWMQIDPQAEKYASMTLYNGMGNNPILFSDMLGDSLKLNFIGQYAQHAENHLAKIINRTLEGQFRVSYRNVTYDKNNEMTSGIMEIIPTAGGGDVNKMSIHGKEFYRELSDVVNEKGALTEVNIDYARSDVHTGNFGNKTIDIADVLQFNEDISELGGTQAGKIIHEITEQNDGQVSQKGKPSKDFAAAHRRGIQAENNVNLSVRKDSRTQDGLQIYEGTHGRSIKNRIIFRNRRIIKVEKN